MLSILRVRTVSRLSDVVVGMGLPIIEWTYGLRLQYIWSKHGVEKAMTGHRYSTSRDGRVVGIPRKPISSHHRGGSGASAGEMV